MSNANVECPHCHSTLEAPTSLQGSEVQCPACNNNFIVNINAGNPAPAVPAAAAPVPAAAAPVPAAAPMNPQMNAPMNAPIAPPSSKLPSLPLPGNIKTILPLALSGLALVASIVAIVITLTAETIPSLKLSSDPDKAAKNYVARQIEISKLDNYFYRKNGSKILKSFEVKDVKTNAGWAVVFYKVSLGTTEVKDAMFLYKTSSGHWVPVSSYTAKKRCQSNWYSDMDEKIDRFKKDNGEFDMLDI